MNGIWKIVFSCVLTAILTAIVGYILYLEETKIPKLDYDTYFEKNYFSKPKFPDDEIKLIINDDEKEKIGMMSVSLFNFSTKDLISIPVIITITPKNASNFRVLAHSAVGANENSDLVVESRPMRIDDKSYIFSYTASSINRVDTSEYGMQLRILFEGEDRPKVSVNAIGISTREYDPAHSPSDIRKSIIITLLAFFTPIAVIVVTSFLAAIIIVPTVTFFSQNYDARRNRKRSKELADIIKEENFELNLDNDKIDKFVNDLLYKEAISAWKKQSLFSKLMYANIAPKHENYNPTYYKE